MPQGSVKTTANSVNPTVGGEELVSLLEKQQDLCRRLKQQAVQQKELVSGDDPSRLLALLADRQELTDELGRLSKRLGRLPERLDGVPMISPARRRRAEELLAEVRQTLGEIVAADCEDMKKLEVRRQSVGSALQAVRARREMLSAYGRGAGAKASRMDRTDEQG